MRKTVAIYVFVIALLSGCSLGNASKPVRTEEGKNQELVLVLPDNPTGTGKFRYDTFQKYADEFDKENPGVDIKIEKLPIASYRKDLNARLADGKQTDLVFSDYKPLLVEDGVYADLLPLFKADRMTTDDLYASLVSMATTNGKLTGIPMSPRPLAVYYNKIWFDKAGIGYPSGDWTWEQYFDLSAKLKSANAAGNKEVYGSVIPMDLTFFETLVESNGGSLLSPDNGTVSGYLDSRPVADTFALLAHQLGPDNSVKKVANMGNPTLSEMEAGHVGMSIAFYGMNVFLDQYQGTAGKTAVAPLPRMEHGKKVNSATFSTLSIAAASQHKELAWKFIKQIILNADSGFQKDWSRQEMLTSKAAIKKLNLEEDPTSKVFYKELNAVLMPTAYRNPVLPSLITAKLVESLVDTPSADAAQAILTDTAHKIDQQLAVAKQQQKE